ncbi:MAG: glucokinase [Sclerophora amabilis]|nr:MAG: glucokinase [Sclerophora amabilis]
MSLLREAKTIAAKFEYGPDDVRAGVKEFLKQMDEGLQKSGQTLSQIPTYVTAVPNGTEEGVFLAVDLGGTNFRVCSIQLHGNTTFTLTQSKVPIPKELMVAKTARELFAFLAKQIEAFLETHHGDRFQAHKQRRSTAGAQDRDADEDILELGFTFSFPVQQQGISKGTLMRWTKGFDIADAIGKDVCALLQEELDALHLPVRVAALVNDTVGTLMARSYTSPGKTGTLLGAIFGTGTNGAYVEKLDRIKKLAAPGNDSDYDTSTGEMILNMEWGSFDNNLTHLPSTVYDEALDKESVNQGFHMFEKRISGMYLGEILRRVILGLIEDPEAQLFKDQDSSSNDIHSTTNIAEDSALYKQWGIDTSFLSVVTADTSAGLKITRQALDRDLGVSAASAEDAQAIRALVVAIGKRSARLSAIAIAAVVLSSGRLNGPTTTPTMTHATETATKPFTSIIHDAKDLNVGEASNAAAETVQAALAPMVDQPPSGGDVISEEDIVDIGVDGSLVEFYPGFEEMLREALQEIPEVGVAGEKRIRIGIAKDGSGVGAALIALVAAKAAKAGKRG